MPNDWMSFDDFISESPAPSIRLSMNTETGSVTPHPAESQEIQAKNLRESGKVRPVQVADQSQVDKEP